MSEEEVSFQDLQTSEDSETSEKPEFQEIIVLDDDSLLEKAFVDRNEKPFFTTLRVHRGKGRIEVFPFSISPLDGVVPTKIRKFELVGWNNIEDLPRDFRSDRKVGFIKKRVKAFVTQLANVLPKIRTVIIGKTVRTKFTDTKATLNWGQLRAILVRIDKEQTNFTQRKRVLVRNAVADMNSKVSKTHLSMKKGEISRILELYSDEVDFSDEDISRVFSLLSMAPSQKISMTENFVRTRDRVNIAYLDEVLKAFRTLMAAKSDNEKDWQKFFKKHGWILSSLLPYQVVLFQDEAYLGGKSLANSEGRVVDFLLENGFSDNYALLEVKTHLTPLLSSAKYREPSVYSMHARLSGAINQCLDQKNVFMKGQARSLRVHDPKCLLLVGAKFKLTAEQSECFELLRANQRNVDIVTYDELLAKIEAWQDLLHQED